GACPLDHDGTFCGCREFELTVVQADSARDEAAPPMWRRANLDRRQRSTLLPRSMRVLSNLEVLADDVRARMEPRSVTPAPSAPSRTAAALVTNFVKVDTGLTLQYVVQGNPRGPVIVLLHGAGDSWHSWELVLPLIPKAYRTYAVSLRGHGLSDHP